MKDVQAKIRKAHRSLTIWFNGVVGILAVALPEVQAAFPQLQEYIPANTYHSLMGVLIAGNIILRFRTTKPLSEK
jgi:hypothetical protein